MRVVAGKYKGKKLDFPQDEKIRPTADMVKQALFSSLFSVEGLCFLDLFCGCGGIGIEALSRGASLVHFVDKSPKSLFYTKKNLMGLENNYCVFKSDYLSFLKSAKQCYDVIFMDPPYANVEFYENALKLIYDKKLLSKGGKVVLEHDQNLNINFESYNVLSKKKYGKKYLTFLQVDGF